MCHWVRGLDRGRNISGAEPPSGSGFMRPRVVGAVAVALLALTAAAALPLATPTTPVVSEPTAPAMIVPTRSTNQPAGPVIEQTAATLDDGVPSSPAVHDSVRASGHCEHGL